VCRCQSPAKPTDFPRAPLILIDCFSNDAEFIQNLSRLSEVDPELGPWIAEVKV